jgi:hypothetical protein
MLPTETRLRALRVIDHMATNGHTSIVKVGRRTECRTTPELDDAVASLNRGDEHAVKAFVLANLDVALSHRCPWESN